MSTLRYTTAIIILSVASFTTLAQTAAEHALHHPTSVAQAAMPKGTTAPRSGASNPMPSMAAMDERMTEMQAMHEKMVNAKTQEERSALMAEHMKTMQDGMSMMNQMGGMGHMGGGGMGGMGGMQGGKSMPGTMTQRQQMMEKRMDMMQSMMQMMMDRMPPAPSK